MGEDQLLALRQKVVESLKPLVIGGAEEGNAGLLLDVIKSGAGDEEIYNQAFEAINNIDDYNEKRDGLMELLKEIDIDLQAINANPIQEQAEQASDIPEEKSE